MSRDIDSRVANFRVKADRLVVDLVDGRTIEIPLSWYPRLAAASASQLKNYRIIGDGQGIHWPELDEDLSTHGMLRSDWPGQQAEFSEPYFEEKVAQRAAMPAWGARSMDASESPPTVLKRLRSSAIDVLRERAGPVEPLKGTRSIYVVKHAKVNLRAARAKRGSAFWFDVTPAYYKHDVVDFFAYFCGERDRAFVFPAREMAELAEQSHTGGEKDVPNFTIHSDTLEFEPAGAGGKRLSIENRLNAFALIRDFKRLKTG